MHIFNVKCTYPNFADLDIIKENTSFGREEQVPPEILDLGFSPPLLSRPNLARNNIENSKTCPNSRFPPLKFLILS